MQNLSKVNVVVITNITVEPFFDMYLQDVFVEEGIDTILDSIPYNEYLSEKCSEKIISAGKIIVWLNVDCFYPNLINDLTCGKVSVDDIEQDIKDKMSLCSKAFS